MTRFTSEARRRIRLATTAVAAVTAVVMSVFVSAQPASAASYCDAAGNRIVTAVETLTNPDNTRWEACGGQRTFIQLSNDGWIDIWNGVGYRSLGTQCNYIKTLAMQGDGNLVAYSRSGAVCWQSYTAGNDGAYLVVQADGNVVLYKANGAYLQQI